MRTCPGIDPKRLLSTMHKVHPRGFYLFTLVQSAKKGYEGVTTLLQVGIGSPDPQLPVPWLSHVANIQLPLSQETTSIGIAWDTKRVCTSQILLFHIVSQSH